VRELLPVRRSHETTKVKHGKRSVFVAVGRYPDGRPGEVFIDTAKEGTELCSLMDAFAMMVSLALQHGCPVDLVVKALKDFEPGQIPRTVADILSGRTEATG
jgi:ribonucleoside-diphosphate reductase alpha chain